MIDGDSVLTAAHCFQGLSDQRVQRLSVRVGSTRLSDVPGQGVRRGVLRVWIHGKYNFTPNNKTDNQYDVAVITLRRPALNCNQSGCGKGTVYLANPSQDYLKRPGTQATVVGWGSTQWGSEWPSYVLQQADSITVRSDQDGEAVWGRAFVPKVMIAAGSQWRGANIGDSGGPLLVRRGSPVTGYVWAQIGIASFVDTDAIRRLTCDLTNWKKCYDVFTEVNNPSILNFIRSASIH